MGEGKRCDHPFRGVFGDGDECPTCGDSPERDARFRRLIEGMPLKKYGIDGAVGDTGKERG